MIRKTWFSLLVLVVTVVCASSQAGFLWRKNEAKTRTAVRPQTTPHFHPSFGYHQTQWRRFPGTQYSEIVMEPDVSPHQAYEPEQPEAPADPSPIEPMVIPSEQETPSQAPSEPVAPAEPAAPAAPAEVEPPTQTEPGPAPAPPADAGDGEAEAGKQEVGAIVIEPTAPRTVIPLPPVPAVNPNAASAPLQAKRVNTPWRSPSEALPLVRPGM